MTRVAVLYQACDPPLVNGVRKPKKPGGYQDSGADIAYVLQRLSRQQQQQQRQQPCDYTYRDGLERIEGMDIEVLTPTSNPDPRHDEGWCFADTEAGIRSAIDRGANLLWANTILFAAHPLQTSPLLEPFLGTVKVLSQPPRLVEAYDDKLFVHRLLLRDAGRRRGDDQGGGGGFTLPRVWTVEADTVDVDLDRLTTTTTATGGGMTFPVVAKPVRGRGSHGVKVCRDRAELEEHLKGMLLVEDRIAMVEEFLRGEEATITVMPPSHHSRPSSCPRSSLAALDADKRLNQSHSQGAGGSKGYWSLPVVTRFNHADGIAPYSGAVAVSANSRALSRDEQDRDPAYGEICRECERVAALLGVTAPIRVDVRRFGGDGGERFAVFDVNMKPVS